MRVSRVPGGEVRVAALLVALMLAGTFWVADNMETVPAVVGWAVIVLMFVLPLCFLLLLLWVARQAWPKT